MALANTRNAFSAPTPNVVEAIPRVRLRNSQDLWIGLSRGVSVTSRFVVSFDEFAVFATPRRRDQGRLVRTQVPGTPRLGIAGRREPGCASARSRPAAAMTHGLTPKLGCNTAMSVKPTPWVRRG
jgi:hypothetical protein